MTDASATLFTQLMISGQPGFPGAVANYERFMTGSTLVEEFWWGELPQPLHNTLLEIADTGWVWARFWLRDQGVVLDRIFNNDLKTVGTHIDVTTPILVEDGTWSTTDLLLDIWLWPDGMVTLLREDHFDQSYIQGHVSQADAERAEEHIRDITRWIATEEFPPAWVMQYQPEPTDEA